MEKTRPGHSQVRRSQKSSIPASPEVFLDPLPGILEHASINLLIGASGVGKSGLLACMSVCFRDGLPIFGHQPNPIPKLAVLAADRSWKNTRTWFERAGWGDVPAYAPFEDDHFNERRLLQKRQRQDILQEGINVLDLPKGSLLIVDPLIMFLGGNIMDYDIIASSCITLGRIARRRQITIIGTVHASKQKGDVKQRYVRLQDRIAGSTALTGYTDTQMYLAGKEELDKPYHLFQWCPHLFPVETFKLQKNELGLLVPYTGDGDHLPDSKQAQEVFAAVPETPLLVSPQAITEATQIPPRSVKRHLAQLGEAGRVIKVGHGQYTRPKPH